MYFPPSIYLSPGDVGIEAAEKNFESDDGSATAWWLPPKGNKPVIMFFHGNGSAVYSNYNIYADLNRLGYGVWGAGYVGYPGLANGPGKPSQSAIVDSAIDQYDHLVATGVKPEKIIFYGTSLGSGVAAQLAAHRKPAMLIAEAPFNSTLEIGQKSMPIFPVNRLMKDKFRSGKALEGLDMPLIWMHGTDDVIIPLSQGRKLYDSYIGPKAHQIFERGQHTNLWSLGGQDYVIKTIEQHFH